MNPSKVLISGVFGGIGQEICKAFNTKNIKVVGMDLSIPTDHELVLEDCFDFNLTMTSDLTKKLEQIYSLHPDIDLVIHNAGIANIKSFLDETQDEFQNVMDINFNSLVISNRFWVHQFKDCPGCGIANMASMAGHVSPSGMTSYSASKHAVVGFTESLKLELEALDIPIKIILISPGFIDTKIMKIGEVGGPPEAFKKLTTSALKAGLSIVESILNGETVIIPDMGGKIMKQMNRWTPGVLSLGNSLIAKKILKK